MNGCSTFFPGDLGESSGVRWSCCWYVGGERCTFHGPRSCTPRRRSPTSPPTLREMPESDVAKLEREVGRTSKSLGGRVSRMERARASAGKKCPRIIASPCAVSPAFETSFAGLDLARVPLCCPPCIFFFCGFGSGCTGKDSLPK